LVPSEHPATTETGAGDPDESVLERSFRTLVIVNPSGFFHSGGKAKAIRYEALLEFEKFAHQKRNTMRPEQLESARNQGLVDRIARQIVVTPEPELRVAFPAPMQKNVTPVVVMGSAMASPAGLDQLAGKAIWVNPLTTYYPACKLTVEQKQPNPAIAGKPIILRHATGNLNLWSLAMPWWRWPLALFALLFCAWVWFRPNFEVTTAIAKAWHRLVASGSRR
jgi:hypothetical protein